MGLGGPMWLASRDRAALAAVRELRSDPAQEFNRSVARVVPDDFVLAAVKRLNQRLWEQNAPVVMNLEGSK